jgi:uncharacterized membrane protein YfcA
MHFDIVSIFAVAVLGGISGLLIGCIGVGGVILVPALVFLVGIPVQVCIAAAMLSYFLLGIAAVAIYASHKSIDWKLSGWLCAGAAPAAFIGAWAVSVVNAQWLLAGIGLLSLLSGLNSLRRRHADEEVHVVSPTAMSTIGAFTGFLSALSGTSGPLVLIPILTALRMPILASIGLGQVVQLPIAITASIGNFLHGEIDLWLAGILAVSLTAGSWFGAKLAHSLPRELLRRIVCGVLIVVGLFVLGNVLRHVVA